LTLVSADQGRVLTGTRPAITASQRELPAWLASVVAYKLGAPVILKPAPSLVRATAVSLGLLMSGAYAMGAWAEEKAPAPKAAVEKPAKKPAAKKAPAKVEISAERLDEISAEQNISQTVVDLAGWVIAAEDNRGEPFAIVDKQAAQILLFSAEGKLKGMAPVLLGSAHGDHSADGVGDRELKDIPMEDRTTPAGRFLAGYGPAYGGEHVLWVDYATAVSIHPIPATKVSKAEKRTQRLTSAKVDDNYVTHGCINVSPTFYKKMVSPLFKQGGVFYVLPDTISLADAFPSFGADLVAAEIAAAESGDAVAAR